MITDEIIMPVAKEKRITKNIKTDMSFNAFLTKTKVNPQKNATIMRFVIQKPLLILESSIIIITCIIQIAFESDPRDH